jgi:MFS family permease
MHPEPPNSSRPPADAWYAGVTRYQWLVLLIASLGWVFDVFEGQIFVASMNEAMPDLVPAGTPRGEIQYYNQLAFAAFLVGGALGGIFFGMLSDRIGRKKTMSLTILFYSLFTFVSAFSQVWWHMVLCRFFVAMGVGGEWAVASAFVVEVFPQRARAWSLAIFHASSVFGAYLAVAAGVFIIGNEYFHDLARDHDLPSLPWRIGFALGVLPALLILWIRRSLREPESWQAARDRAAADPTHNVGKIGDLFAPGIVRATLVGTALAAVGMATYWGTFVFGKDVLKDAAETRYLSEKGYDAAVLSAEERKTALSPDTVSLKRWEMLGMFLALTGSGIGLVCFGPICERVGRRGAFLLYHLGGLMATLLVFQVLNGIPQLLLALPVFGFLTTGMHAGYAVYFPELFPTRLRSTGAGFCFNGGRILAAPILFLSGWMMKDWGYTLQETATLLGLLFLLGVAVLWFAQETRGRELPQ